MSDILDKWLEENTEQRTEQWRDIRVGRFTSSEIWKLMVMPKSKASPWSDKAYGYIQQKVAEELTGLPTQAGYAYPLVYGEETEPLAKEYFSKKTGITIVETGFIPYGDHAGGSPDGLIGEDCGIEIKCPYNPANQIEYITECTDQDMLKAIWPEYYWQCMSLMFFSNRKKWLFVTYDPRMKSEAHRLTITEVEYNADDVLDFQVQLDRAIAEKLSIIKRLQ